MNNLFKRKPKVYSIESTLEEVYQQETFYKVIVEDNAGAMKKLKNFEIILENFFEALKDCKLEKVAKKTFDERKYNVFLETSGWRRDRIVKIIIKKRRLLERHRCLEATKKE